MSRPEQVLLIEPNSELRFKGPFTDVRTSDLKLTNPSERRVCFKVKTTAPKRYCVRPNSGIIEPDTSVGVSVMLQPFEYDPNEKNKHKFMVQTMFAPDGPIESQDNLWKDVSPENLMDSKLKCVFEMPVDTTAQNNLDVNISSEEKPNIKTSVTPEKTSTKTSNVEAEVRKIADENKKLREDLNRLITENQSLKDEGVRLRKVAMSDTVSSTPAPTQSNMVSMDSQDSPALPPIVYLIVALLLGYIIGKFIF